MAAMARPAAPPVTIRRWSAGGWVAVDDRVAAEEPLQLSLNGTPLSIVMRTPGNDLELALGLLLAEKVITTLDDVELVHISAESGESESRLRLEADLLESNQVDVHLVGETGRQPAWGSRVPAIRRSWRRRRRRPSCSGTTARAGGRRPARDGRPPGSTP
jgi:formate dehydrogenase assembly factor FdhD